VKEKQLRSLGDSIIKVRQITQSSMRPDDELLYIDLSSIDKDEKRIVSESIRTIVWSEAPSRARQIVQTGDVLVSTVRPNLNGVAQLEIDFDGAIASTGFCVLRANPEVLDSRYLFHWVCNQKFVAEMVKQATGASYPAVSDRIVLESLIPLPINISDQRRIAAILDKANSIRMKRREAIKLADEFLLSVFLEIFGDPAVNPKGWKLEKLCELGNLERGKSRHRPRDDEALYGGPYPFIQTGDVANSDGVIQRFQQTYSKVGLQQSRLWPAGTLCITIAANIGKTGILGFDACFPDSVVGFTPGKQVTPEYIQFWLNQIQGELERVAPQAAQKNINLEILSRLDTPVPPLNAQLHFSSVVQKIRSQKQRMGVFSKESNLLFQSLQQQAFA
jgi:type I restriction enzyme S subunit